MKYKLSDYARVHHVTYRTAWNRFRAGKIANAYVDETNHVVIDSSKFDLADDTEKRIAVYARVSSSENKKQP